jgi:hypothetical protein
MEPVILNSDIWKEDLIVPDIWFNEYESDPAAVEEIKDYYLHQMNFIGIL